MILLEDILHFSKEHETEDIHTLALQGSKYPQIDISQAAQQIKGLQIAKTKLPTFYKNNKIFYPIHLSLEQCSSEMTALYKAKIAEGGEKMIDLTGGFGVDFFFISRTFNEAIYIEKQKDLYELVTHNLAALGAQNILTINTDTIDYLTKMDKVDFIYIDPARRSNSGSKTVQIEDCTPNLLEIQDLLEEKSNKVMIKLSPMLDITLALKQLKNVSDVHIVSVNNECKELLFIQNKRANKLEPIFYCINLKHNEDEIFLFSKRIEQESKSQYTNTLEEYLYEPNASIMKAGAYNSVGIQFNLYKLHPNTHLYTSPEFINCFPGRKFKIIKQFTLNKKEVKAALHNIQEANILTRNFPLKPEELKKRLKIKDGGSLYLLGTTLSNNQRVLILCKRL